ncbi:hypothetical protein NPIL_678171 [Nephila pilipes]|uniref:Uncharacterized protein n=1 Tax=Nephila pilipes TaxID=299642 RepID=A0A8X6IGD3_NEPPI|nr:hypothetical protein NPIL_678171 [Nephila pilipes]
MIKDSMCNGLRPQPLFSESLVVFAASGVSITGRIIYKDTPLTIKAYCTITGILSSLSPNHYLINAWPHTSLISSTSVER